MPLAMTTTSSIFCPSSHLILSTNRCPVCGWERPAIGEISQPAWEPVSLGAGLGGPGLGVYASGDAAQDVVALPLRNGELVGLNLRDGSQRWRKTLPAGRMTRWLVADGNRILFSISDESSLDRAGTGLLAALDPLRGEYQNLWEAQTSQLSAPTLAGRQAFLRTSTSELLALSLGGQPSITWRQPLQAWWPQPPVVLGDLVLAPDGRATQGEGKLLAFNLADGKPRWQAITNGLLAQLPVRVGSNIVYLDGHKTLACITTGGQKRWHHNRSRVYSNLATDGKVVFLALRGPAPSGQPGHYLLQAVEPETGQIAWESHLPGRASVLRCLGDGTLLLGDDDGRLLACETGQGRILWQYALGSHEDPIQTSLLLANGLLLAGTYHGKLIAIRVEAPPTGTVDIQEALKNGEFQAAADALALSGDLRQAAELYAQELKEPRKALALYEHAGLYKEAGDLAQQHGLHSEALKYFQLADDLKSQARVLEDMGDELGAAEYYEKSGKLEEAARLYEHKNEKRKAMELYKRMGKLGEFIRLTVEGILNPSDVEYLMENKRFAEAAQAAEKIGAWDKAVKIYQQFGQPQKELNALHQLIDFHPEPWALERLAELARKQGQFAQEAQAWERMGRPVRAAEAYQRAARQSEQVEASEETKIAAFYRKAADYYNDAGMEDEYQQCRQKVIHYGRLPQVVVEAMTEKPFREGEWNLMRLDVLNTGRGTAYNIEIRVGRERFEVDKTDTNLLPRILAPGRSKAATIHVRPQPDQVGEAVPLQLEWSWRHNGQERPFNECVSASVTVKRQNDSTGGTPVIINAQNYVAGTYISGDKIENGGQKGDRVEIHRGQGVKTFRDGQPTESAPPARLCPNCHLPIREDGEFCQECGHKFTAKDSA